MRQRIRDCYDRDSKVIYPPVDTDFYGPEPVRREVATREHGEDAARATGRRRVDRADGRVRVGGTNHDRVGLMGQVHVVRVAPEPLEQPRILDTAHRLPDAEFFDRHRIGHDGAGVYARRRAA